MTIKRRKFLQSLGLIMPLVTPPFNKILAKETPLFEEILLDKHVSFKKKFDNLNDRVWIGKDFWAVPIEDWEIKNHRLEFSGKEKKSRLHLLSHVLNSNNGNFSLKANMGTLDRKGNSGSIGFTIAIKDRITDAESIKSACYFGTGLSLGISLNGNLFIGDKVISLPSNFNFDAFELKITSTTQDDRSEIMLFVVDKSNKMIGLGYTFSGDLEGLIALENNILESNGSTFWCSSLEFSGSKVSHKPENSFGPILWTMYTLSEKKLKLSVQLPPIGKKDEKNIELQLYKDKKWCKTSVNSINPLSYTALFEVINWDPGIDTPFRIIYHIDKESHAYEGTVRKEPNKELKFAGLTCQNWVAYPYSPLVKNLEKSNPDFLYFSGDQIYEENGGYPIKREPEDKAILNYLGKWFMFGWAFGNIMRDRPTVCTPDDHDVFQGNLWGEGGKGVLFEEWEKVKDAHGGFVQTPKMINVVNQTQCAHLPDPYQKENLPSGISTWFTSLNYGRLSFAIVSDRLFKSGPEMIRKGEGRIDHITERLRPEEIESDKLSFLGKQQMEFLNKWIGDWENTDMKVLLSQTLFSNVGTHHGPKKEFFYGDMDSGGWPKKQRDEVIKVIRKASASHINGDQHLPFLVQYSINEPRDGGWTFCTPAITTGYPRWGEPDLVNMPFSDRPNHNLPNTGNYRDVFGNNNYIYAVGNPEDNFLKEKNRYIQAQMKASGYGIITFDNIERTIKMEAIRFLANLEKLSEDNWFPGWPLTINQLDNDGRKPYGYLPLIKSSESNVLVKIYNESTNELVQALRIKGNQFKPSVYELNRYKIEIGEGKNIKVFSQVEITNDPNQIIYA